MTSAAVALNKSFFSRARLQEEPPLAFFLSSCAPWCPFFVKVEEKPANTFSTPLTISSHAQWADGKLCDCDCFSIREDYLSVCAPHRKRKSVSGANKGRCV